MNDTPPACGALTLHGINTREALSRFAGNEQRYRHWLLEYVSHAPATIREIRSAIDAGLDGKAINLTHAFKGRSGMLGMTELHSIAFSLEMSMRDGDPTALWFEELERTIDETIREISSVLGQGDT